MNHSTNERTPTLTEAWLADNYDELNKTLRGYLSHRFPLSSERSLIEDHISNFMCELLAKDTLSREDDLTVKGVASLAFNSTHNHIRTMSKDPTHKLRYGGLTEAERKQAKDRGESTGDFIVARNGVLVTQLEEHSASTADLSVEDQVFFVEQIKAMESTLSKHFGKNEPKLDRALKVFNLMLEGYGNREIAQELDITNTMANKWVAKLRVILDSHRLALA